MNEKYDENKLLKAFAWMYLRSEKAKYDLLDFYPLSSPEYRHISNAFRYTEVIRELIPKMRPDLMDERMLLSLGFEEVLGLWRIPIPYIRNNIIDGNTIIYSTDPFATHVIPTPIHRRLRDIPKGSMLLDCRQNTGSFLTSTPCMEHIGIKPESSNEISFCEGPWVNLGSVVFEDASKNEAEWRLFNMDSSNESGDI